MGSPVGMARPMAAAVLTILGGFFILGGGFLVALFGAIFAIFGFLSALFVLGILVGLLSLLTGFLMLAVPSAHVIWGVLAIVLAVASLPFAFGGFLLGFLLTLVGGFLALRWKRPSDRIMTVEARRLPPGT